MANTDRKVAAAGTTLHVVLVTGISGAGRSSTLKVLEDIGYESIDNLPLNLLDAILSDGAPLRPVAVGVDIRTRDFSAGPVLDELDRLEQDPRISTRLLFLDCDSDIIARRYTETRRPHPLAHDRPLADGVAAERRLIEPLRRRADLVIDTSGLSPNDFRQLLTGHFDPSGAPGMTIFVTSFSYRIGVPRAADLVFDMRFLSNPHYVEDLRALSGLDEAVVDHIKRDAGFEEFFERWTALLEPLLPRYESEGKSYLTISTGCTGGRHRSVAMAETLAEWLRQQGRRVTVSHRDIGLEPTRHENHRVLGQ